MSTDALRRHVIAAQGYATRFRRASARDVEDCVRRLSCVQLDSIVTVERSHHLVLTSRVGAFDKRLVSDLLGKGRLFEQWAHEACLLPVEDWPLLKRRMRDRMHHHWWGPVIREQPALARRVMREVRAHGPLRANHFEGASTGMWNLKPEKRMLDCLWTAGRLVVSGRDTGFVRRYDLPERVLPAAVLRARAATPRAWFESLLEKAIRARGALTMRGIVEHYRLKGEQAEVKRHLARLVKRDVLRELAMDDGGSPVYVTDDADVAAARVPSRLAVLLSPFDNLLWDRDFARRVIGFDHLIEVYKPQPQRKYGYYVMPLVVGDHIVGRADVKADREADALRIRRFHREPEASREAAEDGLHVAAERLRRVLDLESLQMQGAPVAH